ncbi:MAG: NAD(P)H-quinone oxidoreductase [Gemmatimonadota bacterium]|nr:NAD(P)H-quinone oxidoreductase [Gemmatimonadota bacterium]
MRAVIITRFGGPEVLEVREVPPAVPRADQVLVRVHASALNRADLMQREGKYPAPADAPADIPGLEFAGEVEAFGASVTRWSVGDRVFGITGGGANAGYAVVHERTLARVPDNLSWTEAAAVPEAFITAHDALVTQAGARTGERILVHAVGSGVGLAAIQLARALGAESFGTARTADKIDRAREYGLSDGCAVRDAFGEMLAKLQEWSGGRGVDVVLDLVGGSYVPANIQAAALKARIMLIGTVAGREATIPLGVVLGKRLTIRGTVLRARSVEEKIAATEAFARDVVPLLASGAVRPVVDRVFALDDIRSAHERLESNESFGKVVLDMTRSRSR